MLAEYKKQFLELAIEQQALRFGKFTLNSGRLSPWFFNGGMFNTGKALMALGECYAAALEANGISFDQVLGPAYKGIPLAISTAIVLGRDEPNLSWTFNRKEAKDHGEGGLWVGAEPSGRVVIIDDVITSGKAIRAVKKLVEQQPYPDTEVVAVLVAVDREERGEKRTLSAKQAMEAEFNIPVCSIVGARDLLAYLAAQGSYTQEINAIAAYLDEYGVC